ncbi:hypothetical protein QE443_004690 [Pantoea ananatis]|uniref:hypothetical protein n=1 Tax=Pantoea ananas TaxID=553 RepID=UPI00278041A8|nr:hypothetical protein [Pantoea ananatis]MDQ1228429.1 hypothetical protein [Pantoea ananatis]
MKLRKPNTPVVSPVEDTGLTKSSFVREAQKAPSSTPKKATSFVLPQFYLDLIADQQEVTGLNRTVVVKAALLALSNMEPNEKNRWLLEATKKK